MEVQLEDQIGSFGDWACETLRKKPRRRADRPPAELTRRRKAWNQRDRHAAAEAGLTVGVGHPFHGAAANVREERVVDDLAGARPELHGPDPLVVGQASRQHEVPIDVRTLGRHVEGGGHFENQVRCAQLPAVRELRQCRQFRQVAARHARLQPAGDDVDLIVGEPPFVGEVAEPMRGVPRRHVSRPRHLHDQLGALRDVLVPDQRERRDFARPMTRHAVGVQDRRDGRAEGRRLFSGGCRRALRGGGDARGDGQRQERVR